MKLTHSHLSAAIVASLLAATALISCKTTEANYAAAYQKAKEKSVEGLSGEEIEGFKREKAMPRTVYNGDSIALKGMYVKHIEGEQPKQYTVIAATFKQIFNARSVYGRLQQAGQPWSSPTLLQNPLDKRYYIGAFTTDSLGQAVAMLHNIATSQPITMAAPCPFILKKN